MRKLVAMTAAGAALCMAAASPAMSQAAMGRSMTAGEARYVERIGCYRWGETGYHRYRFCFGPAWLYPHHRVCRHGYCWYR